jgi:hypothetical protein
MRIGSEQQSEPYFGILLVMLAVMLVILEITSCPEPME